MADIAQYNFEFKEAAAALIKHQGLHEGLWMVGFEISLGAGNFGPTPADAKPGAFMQISRMQLIRQAADAESNPNVVDAAKINP
jgi:hypothetical protein